MDLNDQMTAIKQEQLSAQTLGLLVAIGGNSTVLLIIYRVRALRSSSNILIASLAIADLEVGLVVYPVYIALTVTRKWFSAHLVYRLENFLWIQCSVTSTFTLCAISIDRLIAVTFAIQYKKIITKKRCYRAILSIWITSLLFGCSILFFEDKGKASVLWIVTLVLTFVIPFAVIIYCYFQIFKAVHEQKENICRLSPMEAADMLKNRKAAWTVVIVVSIFFMTFFPNVVFSAIDVSTRDFCEKALVYRHWLWGILLAFSSSAWNPFVYAARIREFRCELKRLFKLSQNLRFLFNYYRAQLR
ncbi:unnamed protein product, partial [Porites evermanni]